MEAGEGEEGRDCLLETQEESQRQASPAHRPPQPLPANFSSSSAPCLPLGLTRVLPPSLGPGTQTSLRPALPDPLPERALVQPGCLPLATWRLTQFPSVFKHWGVWSGS